MENGSWAALASGEACVVTLGGHERVEVGAGTHAGRGALGVLHTVGAVTWAEVLATPFHDDAALGALSGVLGEVHTTLGFDDGVGGSLVHAHADMADTLGEQMMEVHLHKITMRRWLTFNAFHA